MNVYQRISIAAVLSCGLLVYSQGPKDPLIEIHNRLGSIEFQHQAMLQKLAALDQHLLDLDHRVDIHRQEIDAQDPVAQRVVKLEDFVIQHNQAEQRSLQINTEHWANIVGWTRALVLCVFGFGLNEGWKRYSNAKRHRIADAKMATLMAQTNGVAEKLLDVSVAKAHDEGMKEERDNPGGQS